MMTDARVPPTIAVSAKWFMYPERVACIVDHGFAAEYTPDPQTPQQLPVHVTPLLEAGTPVRYHGFFPESEFGHADPQLGERALRTQEAVLDAMAGRGQQVITIHVGLDPTTSLDPDRVVTNLSRLVAHGRQLGITVCLENLRRGPTSDPNTVVDWAQASGAMITFDVGHAVSNQRVLDGALTPIDFIDAFAQRLYEVHMYERETDRHCPPEDMTVLGPIVDRLLETRCTWWTIELDSCSEALMTRALLLKHIRAKNATKTKQDKESRQDV